MIGRPSSVLTKYSGGSEYFSGIPTSAFACGKKRIATNTHSASITTFSGVALLRRAAAMDASEGMQERCMPPVQRAQSGANHSVR